MQADHAFGGADAGTEHQRRVRPLWGDIFKFNNGEPRCPEKGGEGEIRRRVGAQLRNTVASIEPQPDARTRIEHADKTVTKPGCEKSSQPPLPAPVKNDEGAHEDGRP